MARTTSVTTTALLAVLALSVPQHAAAAGLQDLLQAAKVTTEKNGAAYNVYVNLGNGDAQGVIVMEDVLGTTDIKVVSVLAPLLTLPKGPISAAMQRAMFTGQSELALGKVISLDQGASTLVLYQSAFLLADATPQDLTLHLAVAALSARDLKKSLGKVQKGEAGEG